MPLGRAALTIFPSCLTEKGTAMPSRDTSWRADAACRDLPTALFFPDSESPADASPALAVCAVCPVRADCLEFALASRQADGIWGGATEADRRRIRRRRREAATA